MTALIDHSVEINQLVYVQSNETTRRTGNRMVPSLVAIWDMVALYTSFQLLPPWRFVLPSTLFPTRGLCFQNLNPVNSTVPHTGTDPIHRPCSTMFFIFVRSCFNFNQIRESQSK